MNKQVNISFAEIRDAMLDGLIKPLEQIHKDEAYGKLFLEGYKLCRNLHSLEQFKAVLHMRHDTLKEMSKDSGLTAMQRFDYLSATNQMEIVYAQLSSLSVVARRHPSVRSRPNEPNP